MTKTTWFQRLMNRLGAPAGASLAADLLAIDDFVDDLESRLTALRAGYLDELDFDLNARLGSPAGASLAADLAIIDDFVDDLETRLSAVRAGYLDELGPTNIPADLDTLLTRLSALRAGYLDELNFDLQTTLATIDDFVDDLETRLSAVRAGYLDELAAANLPADIDDIKADVQVRTIQSGAKAINAGITKYLDIDAGTVGAEILSIVIEGLISHDWTLDVYIPAADAEAPTLAKSKRNTIPYLAADTEGGLLEGFGVPFNCYLDFTNNGANDQVDQVTITYRSRSALTLTWEG